MKTRVENPELKPEIEKFVIGTLEKCKLFTDVYGHGYAAKRLATNFKKLFTEESNSKAKGAFSVGTSGEMVLFMEGTNGNLLTFEDLKEKDGLQTALHESVHAIFNRTPKECKRHKIVYGTGILECSEKNPEIGRALNEGFTNWVCEKAGVITNSYPKLTNIVRILELAIGPEKVMMLGKGNISKKIPQLLNLDLNDTYQLLADIDQFYNFDSKANDYNLFAKILEEKNNFEIKKAQNPNITMEETLFKALQTLNNNSIYTDLLKNSLYLEYAEQNHLKAELDGTALKYFKEMGELYKENANSEKEAILESMLIKYFMKELKEMVANESFSNEQYNKFTKLDIAIEKDDKTKSKTILDFKESYNFIRKKFFDSIENDIKNDLANGTFTLQKITKYTDIVKESNPLDQYDLNSLISRIMLPDKPYIYERLLAEVNRKKDFDKISDYRLFTLENSSGEKENLYYDTKNNSHFSLYNSKVKSLRANSEIEKSGKLFDITLKFSQKEQKIINSFIDLKDKICQKNPNTQIQIVDHIVIVKSEGEEPTFYLLEGNNWTEAKVTEYIPKNIQQTKSKQSDIKIEDLEVDEISERSTNPFKNMFKNLKERFFSPKPKLLPAPALDVESRIDEEKRRFEDYITHTSDGNVIKTPTIENSQINTDTRIQEDEIQK